MRDVCMQTVYVQKALLELLEKELVKMQSCSPAGKGLGIVSHKSWTWCARLQSCGLAGLLCLNLIAHSFVTLALTVAAISPNDRLPIDDLFSFVTFECYNKSFREGAATSSNSM